MRSDDVEAVLETLVSLHEAQSAHDVDAVLAAYAIDGYANLAGLRAYNEQLMEADAFRGREVDLAHAECFLFRDTALVRPVLYRTSGKTRSFSYHFKRSKQGWRIIDNNRSFVPGQAICTERMLATAGRVVEHRGVLWTRRWNVPVASVWDAVSTKTGLDRWWMTGDVSIDLTEGGRFEHHWVNTVRDFEPLHHITFGGVPGDAAAADNVMRFGMRPDGEGTVFTFYDAFHAHPYPLSLPWTNTGTSFRSGP